MTPAALNELVNRQAGLLGVSWTSADIRDLLERESTDGHAAEAVGLFCYQAKKYFGALAAALGGLDTLVFTGGIGEHAVSVRLRICEGLEFLGIGLSPRRNEAHAPVISRKGSSVTVRVMQTDEDLMIARHTRELVVGVGAPEGNGAASSPATNQHGDCLATGQKTTLTILKLSCDSAARGWWVAEVAQRLPAQFLLHRKRIFPEEFEMARCEVLTEGPLC